MADVGKQLLELVWSYIRGGVSDREFRSSIRGLDAAESLLGGDLYFAIWEPDPAAHDSFEGVKDDLLKFARVKSGFACRCLELSDLAKVHWSAPPESGEDPMAVMDTLETVSNRGRRVPAVDVRRCTECLQWWLVAEVHNVDAYFLRRLDNEAASAIVKEDRWPSEFETASAMQLAYDAAREVPVRFRSSA